MGKAVQRATAPDVGADVEPADFEIEEVAPWLGLPPRLG